MSTIAAPAALAAAGFGFGAYLFSSKDLPFGATTFIESHGITRFFIVHGLVCLAAVSAGALMLSNPPGTPARAPQEAEWQEMLRRPAFYLLWPMFFSGALAGLTVIGILKDSAGEQLVVMQPGGGAGLDEAARRALMLQGTAAGRIEWGLLSDRVGRTAAFALAGVLCLLSAGMALVLGGLQKREARAAA